MVMPVLLVLQRLVTGREGLVCVVRGGKSSSAQTGGAARRATTVSTRQWEHAQVWNVPGQQCGVPQTRIQLYLVVGLREAEGKRADLWASFFSTFSD